MPTHFAAGPSGIKTMANAISVYCFQHGLTQDIDRQAVARRVLAIFGRVEQDEAAILAELMRQDSGQAQGSRAA